MDHSETPWRQSDQYPTEITISRVGILEGSKRIAECQNTLMPKGQDEANAEFIVRACNEYDDTQETLKELTQQKGLLEIKIESQARLLVSCETALEESHAREMKFLDSQKKLIDALDSVISKDGCEIVQRSKDSLFVNAPELKPMIERAIAKAKEQTNE